MINEQKNLVGNWEVNSKKEEATAGQLPRVVTHHEQRVLIACILGEPVRMVKGSMWYYANGEEQYQLFMPFTEHPVQSAIYDYAGAEGKVRVRRRGQRMSIHLECPVSLGAEGINDLYSRHEVRQALAKVGNSDEQQQSVSAA